MIFTYRPEFVHTWGGKSYLNQITLNRLSNRESLAMVTHLLGTKNIDRDLENWILEKTEGVPFFIEEFLRSLKDLKIIEKKDTAYQLAKDVKDVTIPSTIQDVIMARVDSLPEDAKEVLQTGSVIEREFGYELIKQVSGLSEQELLSRLSLLKDAELLFERGIYPESTYIFKHALTQEVVYDSILTRRKKQLHKEIGSAIEQLYKDNLHEYYGILAEHFISSQNYEKGALYCRLVGRKAEKAGSIDDAISYGEKQVACLEKLPQTEAVEKNLIDVRTKLGLYYLQLTQLVKAKAFIDPIVELATELNYKKRVCQINCILGQYKNQVEEDFPKAFECLERALKIGEDLNDLISLALGNMAKGVCLHFNCEFSKGLSCFEKALEINVAANSLWGISVYKAIIALTVYYFQGNINLGYKTSDEALRIADESGDKYSKTHAYTAHGWSCYGKGYLEKAEKNLFKGADFSERLNVSVWAAYAHFGLGHNYFDVEKYNESQKHFERAIFLLQKVDMYPSMSNYSKIALALAKVLSHEKDINLNEIFKYCEDNKIKLYEGRMLSGIGNILLNIDDRQSSEAEVWIKKAIEADKRNGMRWHLGRDYALYADLFKRKGDQSKARENLGKAIEILNECGADGWVEKYQKELASL
jgi:predicted ATPase